MTVIIDVKYSEFGKFLRNNPIFFWFENRNYFVVFKPGDNVLVRSTVKKEKSIADTLWKETNLIGSPHGIHVDGPVDFGSSDDVRRIRKIVEKKWGDEK